LHGEIDRVRVARAFARRTQGFGPDQFGADTDESDLDLLVEPAGQTGLMALAALKIEAEKLLGVEVSVVTPDALPAKFRSDVLQQAKPL
jgi:predicted nucleotidyltransferase